MKYNDVSRIIRFFLLYSLVSLTTCDTGTKETANYNLLDNITKNYNPDVLPNNQSVTVSVKFHIYSLRRFDEISHVFEVSGFFTVIWVDSLLKWDPVNYNGTSLINIPARKIWKPDLAIIDFSDELKPIANEFVRLSLRSDGEVLWFPGRSYSSVCKPDTTYYPFDTQICILRIGSWSYTYPAISLTQRSDFITGHDSESGLGDGIWEIFNITAEDIHLAAEGDNYGQVRFIFHLRRRPIPFLMNTLLPIIILLFLNVLVFKVPVGQGERLSYAITVLLSFAVFFSTITKSMSQNGEKTSYLSAYLTIAIMLSSLVVVLTAVNLNIYHREDEFPHFLRQLMSDSKNQKGGNNSEMWKKLSRHLDVLFYWMVVVAIVSTNIVFCIIMSAYILFKAH